MDRDELIEVEINKRKIKVNISSHLDQTNPLHKGFILCMSFISSKDGDCYENVTQPSEVHAKSPWYKRGVMPP